MIVCPICNEVTEKRDLVEGLPETRCLCGSLFQNGRQKTIFSIRIPHQSEPSLEILRQKLEALTHTPDWKDANPYERRLLRREIFRKNSYLGSVNWLTLIVNCDSLYRLREAYHRDFEKWELVSPEDREEAVEELTRCLKEIEVWETMIS